MADPVAQDVASTNNDLEMTEDTIPAADDVNNGQVVQEDAVEKHISFMDYLRSPIVELLVGDGADQAILTIHQDLLTQSPYFEQLCAQPSLRTPRRLELPEENVEAIGAFLEYLYTGEYFPRKTGDRLERHATVPEIDADGSQLLRHGGVYNLAVKFFMPELKTLAHKKIHFTTSTARGEIAYARYIYKTTAIDDGTARKPVAAFWATRSHVLRHEAEEEFRAMCLEYPQFAFDVLSSVLDQREKSRGDGSTFLASVNIESPGAGRGRKRTRNDG